MQARMSRNHCVAADGYAVHRKHHCHSQQSLQHVWLWGPKGTSLLPTPSCTRASWSSCTQLYMPAGMLPGWGTFCVSDACKSFVVASWKLHGADKIALSDTIQCMRNRTHLWLYWILVVICQLALLLHIQLFNMVFITRLTQLMHCCKPGLLVLGGQRPC